MSLDTLMIVVYSIGMTRKAICTMTVSEAARALGVTRATVYAWLADPERHKLRWAPIRGSVKLVDAASVEAEKTTRRATNVA